MKLIVGLGNIDRKYNGTRHNVGFDVIDFAFDNWLKAEDFSPWQDSPKFQTFISEGKIGREKIILAKPTTYMNNSGLAVRALMTFYKIKAQDLIVIQDELDLPLGKYKIQTNRSSAGHNGIISIISEIGTQDFTRIRVGIYATEKEKFADGAGFVLSKFNKEEEALLEETKKEILAELKKIV